jgi:hypothetical protein
MRRNGITSREQEVVYVDAKKQRSDALLLMMSRERSGSTSSLGFGTGGGAAAPPPPASHTVGSGNHLLANAASLFAEPTSSPTRGIGIGGSSSSSSLTATAASASAKASSTSQNKAIPNSIITPLRKITTPINVSEADGVDLLTPVEKTLCSNLRILPRPYLVIKETILREAARLGGVMKRRQARELIKIDVNKTSRLYDFFVEMGWIVPSGLRGSSSNKEKERDKEKE